MKKKSKISIKYFLNENLKPTIENLVLKYPLYINLSVSRKNVEIRSLITKKYISKIELETDNTLILKMEKEERVLIKIIENIIEKFNEFDTQIFYEIISEIRDKIKFIENEYVKEVTNKGLEEYNKIFNT